MNFWDVIGWLLWVYVFVAYLFALFMILGDLFRDRALNGWWKAVWIVFLIFVPILTALVYLIARGRGMAERHAAAANRAHEQTDAYIQQVAGRSPATEIEAAGKLLEAGEISESEYHVIKAKALA